MTFKIVVVDDHELVRSGLRRAFEMSADFDVVGEASKVSDARSRIAATRPDVVTLDIRLPDGDGLSLAQELRQQYPDMGLVILTMYPGDDQLFGALDAGANAFVAKSAPVADVVTAAAQAATNAQSFNAADLAGALRRRRAEPAVEITARELEVLRLLAEGYGVSQVSRRLHISDSTTKTHVTKIYSKLGAANRAQALMTAIRLGLIDSPDQH